MARYIHFDFIVYVQRLKYRLHIDSVYIYFVIMGNIQIDLNPGGGGHCLFEGRYPLPNIAPAFQTCSLLSFL